MPSRPVVGISSTMIARCSKLASTIIKYVADRQPDSLETKSRENLQAVFTQTNSRLREESIQKRKNDKEPEPNKEPNEHEEK